MSLEVVPFKSLGVLSYSTSVAVCDIFNVKEWPDLEKGLGSFKVIGNGTIDRSHTSLNT